MLVMQATEQSSMGLHEDELREVDRVLLGYLKEGRVTSAYARKRMIDEGVREDVTTTYLNQRLIRLEEHGHARNLYDSGQYEFVEDVSRE